MVTIRPISIGQQTVSALSSHKYDRMRLEYTLCLNYYVMLDFKILPNDFIEKFIILVLPCQFGCNQVSENWVTTFYRPTIPVTA